MNRVRKLAAVAPWTVWNTERMLQEKDANPRSFARGFQMRAFTDDERMFPSFTGCFSPGVSAADIAQRGWPMFAGLDLAGKNRPGNVLFVLAVDPNTQKRYPVDIQCGNWSSPETAMRIDRIAQAYQSIQVIMVENNGYQQAIIDWIKNSPGDHSYWYKIEAFTTGSNKNSLTVGLPSLEVEFKNRAWVIPSVEFEHHPVTCRCGWCTWIGEIKDYPMSATSDAIMACWLAREGVSRWGVSKPARGSSLNDFNVR